MKDQINLKPELKARIEKIYNDTYDSSLDADNNYENIKFFLSESIYFLPGEYEEAIKFITQKLNI